MKYTVASFTGCDIIISAEPYVRLFGNKYFISINSFDWKKTFLLFLPSPNGWREYPSKNKKCLISATIKAIRR